MQAKFVYMDSANCLLTCYLLLVTYTILITSYSAAGYPTLESCRKEQSVTGHKRKRKVCNGSVITPAAVASHCQAALCEDSFPFMLGIWHLGFQHFSFQHGCAGGFLAVIFPKTEGGWYKLIPSLHFFLTDLFKLQTTSLLCL